MHSSCPSTHTHSSSLALPTSESSLLADGACGGQRRREVGRARMAALPLPGRRAAADVLAPHAVLAAVQAGRRFAPPVLRLQPEAVQDCSQQASVL